METSSSSSTSRALLDPGVPEAHCHCPKLSSGKRQTLRRDGVIAKSGSTASVQPNYRSLALETVRRGSTYVNAVTCPIVDPTLRTSSKMDLPSRGRCGGHRPPVARGGAAPPRQKCTPDTTYESLERWRTIEGDQSAHHRPVEERRGFF